MNSTQTRTFEPSRKEFRRRIALSPPTTASSEWKELKEQAICAFESGLLPHSIDSAQKAVTVALMGKEVGLSPLQALCRGNLMLHLITAAVPGAPIPVKEALAPLAVPPKVCVSDLPAKSVKPVTEKQVQRLFGIAHGRQWTRAQVGECLVRWFRKSNPLELTRSEYERICNFILDTPGPSGSIEELLERRKAS